MIHSCEKNIKINYDEVIDTFGSLSEILKNALMFK